MIDGSCVECVMLYPVAVLETYGKLREQMANKRSVLFSNCSVAPFSSHLGEIFWEIC